MLVRDSPAVTNDDRGASSAKCFLPPYLLPLTANRRQSQTLDEVRPPTSGRLDRIMIRLSMVCSPAPDRSSLDESQKDAVAYAASDPQFKRQPPHHAGGEPRPRSH